METIQPNNKRAGINQPINYVLNDYCAQCFGNLGTLQFTFDSIMVRKSTIANGSLAIYQVLRAYLRIASRLTACVCSSPTTARIL